jgi:hypothetical protein
MPLLGRAKQRIGSRIASSATASEGKQNLLSPTWRGHFSRDCRNALFGAWWADPVVALFIAYVAIREGREAWRGDACCAHEATAVSALMRAPRDPAPILSHWTNAGSPADTRAECCSPHASSTLTVLA